MWKIEYEQSLRSGVEDIDWCNRYLIEIFNKLTGIILKEKNTDNIKALLVNFADEVSPYFRIEESYWRERLDELEYLDHKERHLFFEESLRDPVLRSTAGHADIEELVGFLRDWLVFHIKYLNNGSFCSTSQ